MEDIKVEENKINLNEFKSSNIINAIFKCITQTCGETCPLYDCRYDCVKIIEEFFKHYDIISQLKNGFDNNHCKDTAYTTWGCNTGDCCLDSEDEIEYNPNDYDNHKVLDAVDIAYLIGEPIRVRNLKNDEMTNVIVDWVLFEKDEFEVGVVNCDDVYSNSDYGFYQY